MPNGNGQLISEQQIGDLLESMGVKLAPGRTVQDVHKSISSTNLPGTGTGMFPYNLEERAMLLIPERTPLSNRGMYAVKGGEVGTNKEYRAITLINNQQTSGFAPEASPGVTGRGVFLGQDNLQRKKVFQYIAPESQVSLIEELVSDGFDAVGAQELASLVAARELEERHIIGDSSSLLGTTTGLTATPFATGGSLAALATYRVAVSPIDYWLWWKLSRAKVTADVPVLGAPAQNTAFLPGTFSRFGEGIAQASGADIPVVAGGRIDWTINDIPGAMAYAVWLSTASGVAGSWFLVALSGANGGTIKSTAIRTGFAPIAGDPSGTGGAAVDRSTFDNEGQNTVLDSFFSQTVNDPDVPGFVQNLGNSAFTAQAGGSGCAEIDNYFQFAFTEFGFSPDAAWAGPKTLAALSNTVLGSGSPAYRLNKDADKDGYIDAGSILRALFNQYGEKGVPIFSHPLLPEGHVYFYKQKVPFPQSRIPTGVNMVYHNVVRFFKQRFARTAAVNMSGPWAITSYGGFCLYFPSGNGVIKGIKV
jgi:hypothetical protein